MKDPAKCTSIEEVRSIIDAIDSDIIELLAKRQKCVAEIVRFKKNKEEVVASDRQEILYAQRKKWAREKGLSPELIETMYKVLIDHNINRELDIFNSEKKYQTK